MAGLFPSHVKEKGYFFIFGLSMDFVLETAFRYDSADVIHRVRTDFSTFVIWSWFLVSFFSQYFCDDLKLVLLPVDPTRKKIDQSDSFLPTTELAYKEVIYFQNLLNKRELNILKHWNKSEKSCTYFLTFFNRIHAEFWCEMFGKLMLTAGE